MRLLKLVLCAILLFLLVSCATQSLNDAIIQDPRLQGQSELVFRGCGEGGIPIWVQLEGPSEGKITLFGDQPKSVVLPPGLYLITLTSPRTKAQYSQLQLGSNSRVYLKAIVSDCGALGWRMFREIWSKDEIAQYESLRR